MKIVHLNIYIITFLSVIFFQCDGSLDSDLIFTGVARTDEVGNILEDDPNDWQPRLNQSDEFSVGPAYPNPFSNVCAITISLRQAMYVRITLNSTPSKVLITLCDRDMIAGLHQFSPSMSKYSSGIYRVYFFAEDQSGNSYTSYGDIHLLK